MSFTWHDFHGNLMHSSSTLNFQRGFAMVRNRHHVLTRFADPAALLDHLHRGDASSDKKNTILTQLIESAKSDDRAGDCALTLMLLALWPGLDGVFRRSRARHLGQVDELASEILARATAAIRGLDLTKVSWVAATIVKNVERDVLRAHNREASRQAVQDKFDVDLHGGVFEIADPELEPGKLLAELTRLIGVDADLVLRVVIDGYTQAEAGQQLGLTEPAARKRFQRALKRLRDQTEQKS
ncbi:RNA polymerase sigma factor [Erythrobacter aurantius]|uniref:RNA polymerase sigma factor n=1 Tax=Erythrobacter aurantius TaxID=2909249 RepID=UPI00207A003E|nr:sigma-70 family RNA polymerase sigma factor [Erythrobacter aurantius]